MWVNFITKKKICHRLSWYGCHIVTFACILGLAAWVVEAFHPALSTIRTRTKRSEHRTTLRLDHRGTKDVIAPESIVSNDALPPLTDDRSPDIAHFTRDVTKNPYAALRQRLNRTSTSFISQIRSHRLAGFDDVVISLSADDPFIVVTGESASGKSLFLVRALELLTGTIAAAKSYVPVPSPDVQEEEETSMAFVEVQVFLTDPHRSALEAVLQQLKLDVHDDAVAPNEDEGKCFTFRRTLQWIPITSPPSTASKSKYRFQSSCSINGQTVATGKEFFALTRPLVALVDATIAVNQILSPAGGRRRTQLLDAAVARDALRQLQQTKRTYFTCRRRRRQYEQELQQQQAYHGYRSKDAASADEPQDRQLQLLSHYIAELDGFESRIIQFCQSILGTASGKEEERMSSLLRLGFQLSQTTWGQNSNAKVPASKKGKSSTNVSSSFVSKLYVLLLEFRNAVETLEDQQRMAQDMVHALRSPGLSSNSAIAALSRTRTLLVDIVDRDDDDDNEALQSSTEQIHELLHEIEDRIQSCTKFIEANEEYGLMPILQNTRDALAPQVTVEYMDSLLQEWKTLSRKHNVSPYMLPWCHANYQRERDGTSLLATELLPRARDNERLAAKAYQEAYNEVTRERQHVAQFLSTTLTEQYLPVLGLFPIKNQTAFVIETAVPLDVSEVENDLPPMIADTTDFVLVTHLENQTAHSRRLVHEVASAGERARILLALECALPGAIGAALQSRESMASLDDSDQDLEGSDNDDDDAIWYMYSSLPPIAIVYDEIDSHVGGRAAQSVTRCLWQQSRQGFQIVSITHNPTVAAAAQTHIIVQRGTTATRERDFLTSNDFSSKGAVSSPPPMVNICTMKSCDGADEERRIQELVRMVGGDNNAANYLEARTFAKSLIQNSQELFS